MAQTAPPLPGEGTPRPLPRGSGRPARSRDTRPRFQPLDALWIALLAALFAGMTYFAWDRQPLGIYCLLTGMGTVVLTYLLGWRASGRPAGVIAGLLLATSSAFASASMRSLPQDLFALVSVAALFAFVAGSSVAALALAAAAVWLRPDGVVLGLMLLTFTLIQHRQRAWLGMVLFLVPTVGAAIYSLFPGPRLISQVGIGFSPSLWVWLATPATLFASWFLLPFLGEIADPIRRARWLPVALWTALSLALGTVITVDHARGASAALVPFLPLWFLLTGAGLARLLPVMTGDLPMPALRYVVATLAVLSLVAIRARTEWPPWSPHSAVQASAVIPAPMIPMAPDAPPAPVSNVPVAPVPMPKHKSAPRKPGIARSPNAYPKAAKLKPAPPRVVKPAVRLYAMKNGRLVRRSKWAIQWDLTHPRP